MSDTVRCIVRNPHGDTDPLEVSVNGTSIFISREVEQLLPRAHYNALVDSSYTVDLAPDLASSPAAPAAGADDSAAGSSGVAVGGAASDPLDHDGDGHAGGSKPGKESTAAKGAKRKAAAKASTPKE